MYRIGTAGGRSQRGILGSTQRATSSKLNAWVINSVLCVFPVNCHFQSYCREVAVQKALYHPNILSLLGVTMMANRPRTRFKLVT
jgi:hypothetical protein